MCNSIAHLEKACPNRKPYKEDQNGENKTYYSSSEHVTSCENLDLVNSNTNDYETVVCDAMDVSAGEAMNFMVLDTACPKNVAGKAWLDCFLESLDEDEKCAVKKEASDARFKFGSGKVFSSLFRISVPVCVADCQVELTFDVVESDIPLLLGKQNMKMWNVVIKTGDEVAEFTIDGQAKTVGLYTSHSGHWCVPIYTVMSKETMMTPGVYIVLLSPPIVGGEIFQAGEAFQRNCCGGREGRGKKEKGEKCGEEMERGK